MLEKGKKYPGPEKVEAWACWAIFADYDSNAPDSADCFNVSTEELAKEVVAYLNEDPRAHNELAFVDGWEHCKTFEYCKNVLLEKGHILTTTDEVLEILFPDGIPEE